MTEARRFCENCGARVGEAANFCPNCGSAKVRPRYVSRSRSHKDAVRPRGAGILLPFEHRGARRPRPTRRRRGSTHEPTTDARVRRRRPAGDTQRAELPGPWWYAFPGAEDAPAFVFYSGIALDLVGIVAFVGLWILKTWGYWLTVIGSVLNVLLGMPGLFLAPGAGLEAAIALQTIGFVLVVVLVVLPTSRRAFSHRLGFR